MDPGSLEGRALSHYQVLERIGAGGMGVVYRAHDTRLDRDVAIKVLLPETLEDEAARRRFRREALAISRLNHPYIAAVYDFNSQDEIDYLVMEHVAGQTIAARLGAGPLPEDVILRLGLQVAEALEAAHDRGIIHRDLKPGNIMVTPQGHAKVLDFGLARRFVAGVDQASVSTLTGTQSVAGTLPYMAPEQLLGEDLDARTDLCALGVILYEMASGSPPFEEPTAMALGNAILNRPARPLHELRPGISARLEAVVSRCLEKSRESRYPSARELIGHLDRPDGRPVPPGTGRRMPGVLAAPARVLLPAVGAAVVILAGILAWRLGLPPFGLAHRAVGSIAVLPFATASSDTLQQYFVDGVAGELSTRLSRVSSLRVISSGAMESYRDSTRDPSRIGRTIGVDAVLIGSVDRDQERARVKVSLVTAASKRTLLTVECERAVSAVTGLTDTLALQIARAAGARISRGEESRIGRRRFVNPAAHEEYLKGQFYFGDRISAEGHRKALEHFTAAIRIDPGYAPAWAGLAQAYWSLSGIYEPAKTVMPKATEAAAKALGLDPDLPEAHAALGVIRSQYDWEWTSAEWEIRRAIQLQPSYAFAHFYYAQVLTETGRVREALPEFKRAMDLEPLSMSHAGWEAMGHYYAGQYDEAIARFRALADGEPDYATWRWSLGFCYEAKGLHALAIAEFKRAVASADAPTVRVLLGYAYAAAGRRSEALEILRRATTPTSGSPTSAYFIAVAYTALGDRDHAMEWLNRAYANRDEELAWAKVDPKLAPLRGDPRFVDLLRRMRLAD